MQNPHCHPNRQLCVTNVVKPARLQSPCEDSCYKHRQSEPKNQHFQRKSRWIDDVCNNAQLSVPSTLQTTVSTPGPTGVEGAGGCRRARAAVPVGGGGPGRGAGRRRQGQGGPRDRPLRAKLACGDLAGGPPPSSTHSGQAHQDRPRDGRKSAGPCGARNTRGATSNTTSWAGRRPRCSPAHACGKPRPADAGRGFRYPVGYEV